MPDSGEVSAADKDSEMNTPDTLKRVFTGVVTHNSRIDPPTNRITESNFHDEALVALVASEWVVYYRALMADLQKQADLNESIKKYLNFVYEVEINKYNELQEVNKAITGVRRREQHKPEQHDNSNKGTYDHNNNIKANMPEKFNGRDLDLFIDNMQTYFQVTNTPMCKQPGVLRLNLTNSVNSLLTNTNTDDAFWTSSDKIITALKQLYQQPNKVEAAQTQLKTVKMEGFALTRYFTRYISLLGQAKFDPNEQQHKTSFYQGLNNFATRGGLRTQVMHLVRDPEKTLKDIYVEADKLLQNEHGTSYNNKRCSADLNEHINVTKPVITGKQKQEPAPQAEDSAGGWTKVTKRKAVDNKNSNNSNNKRTKIPYHQQNHYNAQEHCNRCKRQGHTEETCNARFHGFTGKELPIKTAANFRKGLWKKDSYPEKKNPENNNTINAISATKPEVEELTAKVHNFGISTLANEEEAQAGTSSLKKPSYKDQLQGQRK